MDHEYLPLDLVAEALNLEKGKIFAIYQFGSRVYQSHSKSSDYDLFVVYGTEFTDKVEENDKFKIGGHISDINTFKNTIINHSAVSLSVLWLPPLFVVFENEEMSNFRKNFMIDLKKLERGYLREESICVLKSRRLYKHDKKKSLKNLVHGVRYLLFGIQIAKVGKIYDYTVGNKYHDFMLTLNFETWDEYHQKFEKIYESLHEELKSFVFEEKKKYYEKYSSKSNENSLEIIQFLKENDVKLLTKIFSIQVELLENNLISLISDPKYSNMTCLLNQECQSTVILNQVSFINSYFQYFDFVVRSFTFSKFTGDVILKYAFKRPKYEILLFYHNDKFQTYPQNPKFLELLKNSDFSDVLDTKKSYIFSIDQNYSLDLLGIINNETKKHEELPSKIQHQLSTFDDMKKEMKIYDPLYSGYIVVDENFNHYFLEYPLETFSRNIDELLGESDKNVENILEFVRHHSNHDVILKYFEKSEIHETVELVIKTYRRICKNVNKEFEKIKEIENMKDYSLKASQTDSKHELIGIRNSNVNCLEEFWENIPIKKIKNAFKREMKHFK